MKEVKSVPFAPSLIESIRAIGYSAESAVADLIDNSISAGAKRIDIYFSNGENSRHLKIIDDGCGMDSKKLEEAMRYGSQNPNAIRHENDLGRFGLGMKSASLSMCRKLVVFSKVKENICAFSWDLDHIIKTGEWTLLELDETDIEKYREKLENFFDLDTGTCIYLENFDRIGNSTQNIKNTMDEKMNEVYEHIALVFHRYINENNVKIAFNKSIIIGRDPFLQDNKKTQILKPDTLHIDESIVEIQPFVLPFFNLLSKEDLIKVGGLDSLQKGQGFYVYRNKRLIVYGTWFRLERKNELSKHARIRVDIPNNLDNMWQLDVKKSTATLPDSLRQRLRAIVLESVDGSVRINETRGTIKRASAERIHPWEILEDRDKGNQFVINRDIPQIGILTEELTKKQLLLLENILMTIEKNLPHQSIYNDFSKKNLNMEYKKDEHFKEELDSLFENDNIDKNKKKELLQKFLHMPEYGDNEEIRAKILEILRRI